MYVSRKTIYLHCVLFIYNNLLPHYKYTLGNINGPKIHLLFLHSVAPAYSNDGLDTWSFLMTILHQCSIREYPLNVRYYTIMN